MKKSTLFFLTLMLSVTVNESIAMPVTNENVSLDALHLNWLDPLTPLGDNFYGHANGTWQKQNPIPADYSSWGTFSILQEQTQQKIHQLLIDAAKNTSVKRGSIEQKVGDFYFSGMDEDTVNKQGIEPLQPEFSRITAIHTPRDLQAEIAHLHRIGIDVFFAFGSMQDFKHSTKMIGAIIQGGLSLPDRDYYLKTGSRFKKIRTDYLQHMTRMFQLLGDDSTLAAKEANTVMTIETTFAQSSLSQTAMRDPAAIYHMIDVNALDKSTSNFSWVSYLAAIGQPEITRVNLATPDFIHMINQQLSTVSLNDWKIYLRWHLLNEFAPYLSRPFVEQNFSMLKTLTGSQKILPRWKRVVSAENGALGFAIGKLYVDKYFSADAKREVIAIVHNIRTVLNDDLQTLPWMTPATRRKALEKLDLMEERVGYPSKWWDYSSLNIDRGPYVLNVMRASEFLIKRDLDKIGKPVDRTEWGMTPQAINAYYDPSMNSINLPTGILQPPFFDATAPAAVNYGSIGFVIGHEITHGFDDQGSKFDGHGNLNNWWTPVDLKRFQDATQCIVKQFSTYKVDGDIPVQGSLVVGEATADLGGLTLAYRAFHASKDYKTAQTINGITPDQQFFLGTAHVWANNIRPEQARNLVTIDPHPPALYRVNGTLANMPQFQAAFGIKKGSPMVNEHRCVIW